MTDEKSGVGEQESLVSRQFKLWSEDPYFDDQTREELLALHDEDEISDRFYTELEFGTGGLRGILGAGTNRMNKYVIRKVTQGLADYVCQSGEEGKKSGVVIAYDSRHFSKEFAWETALVLAKNGVHVYIFEQIHPTPVLSFAVRFLKAQAGIVVTASHNPKDYNGYKVYGTDGSQINPDQADQLVSFIQARPEWREIEPLPREEAEKRGLIHLIGSAVDEAYLQEVKKLALYPGLDQSLGGRLRIAYTPLHGTGLDLITKALSQMGFSSFWVVKEQAIPDPDFTTVPYPNPEIPSTFHMVDQLAESVNADLVLASDPDADRLGVSARNREGKLVRLSGNEVGILLSYYILTQKKALGILPDDAVIIKTIASTDMIDEMGKVLGAKVESVLTGFKFIAVKEKELEEQQKGTLQFAFEESIGYRAGSFVRDKDSIIAASLVSEAALYYKEKENATLPEVLEQIYGEFAYYCEDTQSMAFAGREGKVTMDNIMEGLRREPLPEIAGLKVGSIDDYKVREGRDLLTASVYPLTLPMSNVLRYSFQGGGFVMARPSGTEPKIKFYFCIRGKTRAEAEGNLKAVKEAFLSRVKSFLP